MALDFEALKPIVQKAARAAGSTFPSHYDPADTEQAIWVWVVEKESTVRGMVRDLERPEKTLYDLMLKVAYEHLKIEDRQTYHYSEEDAFYYSTHLIKEILEVVFHHEDWISFATALDKMPKGKSDPSKSGNNLASYSDVKAAAERLPEEQYNAIVWRYKYQYSQAAVGAELGITREGARQLLERAVASMQRDLGRRDLGELRNPSETPSRPSTGASARARLEQDYEG